MESKNERFVSLEEVDDAKASDLLKVQASFANVKDAVPKYKKVDGYTTFRAEYGLVGDDIVIHFFDTKERPISLLKYWQETFPRALNEFGQEYFSAGYPRLTAKYTPEMKSWWFRARGYDHLLDVDSFVLKFLDGLDGALDPESARQ